MIKWKKKEEANKVKPNPILKFLKLDTFLKEIRELMTQAFKSSQSKPSTEKEQTKLMKKMLRELRKQRKGPDYDSSDSEDEEKKSRKNSQTPAEPEPEVPLVPLDEEEIEIALDDPNDPNWIKDPRLGNGKVVPLIDQESKFWTEMIEKYLKPIAKDVKKEKAIHQELIELRNNASFGFWFINLLWILFNYMVNRDNTLNRIYIYGYETQPLGFVFIIFFMVVLICQLVGMVLHRWETFLQLISITEITSPLHLRYSEGPQLTTTEALKVARNFTKQTSMMDDVMEPVTTEMRSMSQGQRVQAMKDYRKGRRERKGEGSVVLDMEGSHRNAHVMDLARGVDRFSRERQLRRRSNANYREAIPRNLESRLERSSLAGDRRRSRRADRRVPSALGHADPRGDRGRHARRGQFTDDLEARVRRRMDGYLR